MDSSSDPEQEPGPTRRGQASLGRLLEGVLAHLDLGSRLQERLALAAWAEVVGQVVAAHTRAEAVRDGVLLVAADTPAWAQELAIRRQELLAKLARHVGEGAIRDLHFRSGSLQRARGERRREPRPADITLSGRQLRQAMEAAQAIEDPALRARAERAFLALTRIGQWRRETGWRRCQRCGRWQRAGRRWCASCTHGVPRRRRG